MAGKAPYLIGITGGSASGKTYLLALLQQHLPADKAVFVSMDHYYRDLAQQPREPDGSINFDKPEAIDEEKFYGDILALRAGRPAYQREYTFNQPGKVPRLLTFHPAPIVIAEGLFLFYWKRVRELFDLRIFMDAEEPYRFMHRLRRDKAERSIPEEVVIHQYLHQVLPAYKQFVEPLRRYAHIIIQNQYGDLLPALRVLLDHIRAAL
ncbi:MAG: uridine-cytidine kinase [Bacteroidia bacterium]|nr:uridine-cytidine kinase [Bacteroidia bacterium]MDW8235239.1 uridine-cytidine kinase [Bacteroidia bacterium]